MKSTLAIELIANAGKLISEINRSGGAVSRFSAGARNQIAAIGRAAGSIQGQLAGLGISIGAVAIAKQSAQLDKQITRIGQTASASKNQVGGLRKELFTMAKDTGAEVEQLASGFDVMVQKGVSWKASLESIKAINRAGAVGGANSEVLAQGLTVGSTIFGIDLEKSGKALELLDKMTVAGRLGGAELENLSESFARVGARAKDSGLSFESTLGFLEVLSRVQPDVSKLGTLADSTLRVFTNFQYMKKTQKATGVKFFDAAGARREVPAVLADIKKKFDAFKTSEQRSNFLGKVFGEMDNETLMGMSTLLSGSNIADISAFTSQIEKAGGTLKRDFDDATRNLIDQSGRLKVTLREAADGFAAPIKNVLTEAIQKLLDAKEKGGMALSGGQLLAGGAAIVGAGMIASKLGSNLASKWLGKGGNLASGVATGKALEAAAGVIPVYVTNMGDMGASSPWSPKPAVAVNPVAAAGASGLRATIAAAVTSIGLGSLTTAVGAASVAAVGGVIAAGGLAGYGIGMGINKGLDVASPDGVLIGETLNRIAAFFGNEESKRAIEINMNIDQQGRIVTTSNDMQTKTNVTLPRGRF